jgi:2-C-methyl-D-erythritol 4-phosphate cytidylyltransferase/2-C-methyl-D-erythritol 2,4-cyclodiphosphate synthase
MTPQPIDAILVAAGRGTRLGGDIPKQYLPLGGRAVVARAAAPFLAHPWVRRVVVAINPSDAPLFEAAAPGLSWVAGGETRQESVRAALESLAADPPSAVLVHDGARPFVSPALIDRVVAALAAAPAAIPVVPVSDTLKRIADGRVAGTVPRESLAGAQTPQGFHYRPLRAAHAAAPPGATDDAAVMEAAGHHVAVVPGERGNVKITTADDLSDARRLFALPAVGKGFDVHRLVPGGPLILGGLEIPFDQHLDGHSDADVALHALTDALFGAIADGDIGHHFPPSDPTWKGAASDQFLRFAATRVRAVADIAHLDLTIICERPKIGPHREAMRARIAEITGLPAERVAVKATTTERLGFTGRGEGIAAEAVATILRHG